MAMYSCKEVSPGLYEVKSPNRTVMLEGYEITAILDYFREREWEDGIRDAINDHPECDLIENVDEFFENCLDEIRSKYEIYGEFNGNYKDIVTDMITDMIEEE